MNIKYDPDVDVLLIQLAEGDCAESDEVSPGIIIDFDDAGTPLVIEILEARRVLRGEVALPFQLTLG